jgi:glycosyltransferase involved in cell wall biosynthesis
MSFGRAVVAPALGCLPETVPPDAGILYDPDAPDALTAALRRALGVDLEAMGRAARARAEELDWGPIARRTARLYTG